MTVNTSTTAVELEGNGVAREFSFSPIRIFDETQLEVVVRDDEGNLTTISRGTGSSAYSVQATFTDNQSATGSIRYPDSGGTLLPADWFISIRRVVPLTQTEIDLENQGGYLPEVQEQAFDLMAMRAQQLQEQIDRSVQVPFGSALDSAEFYNAIVTGAATATTKAGEAAASATAAASSASAASTSASAASTSASAASTSASTASTAATTATDAKNAAETAETNAEAAQAAAETAETGAATSASTATTKASEASTSASNAATAQLAAESARDATLAAFDNFDDRYLGVKSSDPTLANDGNALVAGALYFNSADGAMKVYTGSAWVAAYVSGSGYLAAANNLSDLGSASTARNNLGLGTIATQAANNVSITGGSVTGITDLAVVDGGTGASDASTARANLGLTIGTHVQAYNANLASLAGVTLQQGDILYATGANTLVRLAKGTANQELRMNAGATAPEWYTPSSGGPVVLAVRTASTSSTLDFTSVMNDTLYWQYELRFCNLSISPGGNGNAYTFYMNYSTNNGSSWSSDQTLFTGTSGGGNQCVTGIMQVFNPAYSDFTNPLFEANWRDHSTGGFPSKTTDINTINPGATINALRFKWASGTMAKGHIIMIGYPRT